jgi:hypothetical protein
MQTDLQVCLAALARVSMTETVVFMRAILQENPDAMMLRTLRRILPALPTELQSDLRDAFRTVEVR